MKAILTLIGLMGLLGWSVVVAAQPDASARQKAAVCAGCHGENGKGANPLFPKLAGQNVKYLSRQLHFFKDQTRDVPAMNAIAGTLSDEDIMLLSEYYARQTPVPEAGDGSTDGEKIYRAGIADKKVPACIACHGPNAEGNEPAGFPLLKGQYVAYTVKALGDYASGVRGEAKAPMRDIAARMNEEEMKAVAAFVATMK